MAPNTSESVTEAVETIKDEETIVRTRVVSSVTEKSLNTTKVPDHSSETHKVTKEHQGTDEKAIFKPQIRWPDLLAQVFVHAGWLCGFYYLITLQAKFYTYIWCKFPLETSF